MKKLFALLLLSGIALHGQGQKRMPHYKLIPVPAANVTLTDSFWKPRIETAFHEGFDWVTLHFDPNNGGYRTFRESQRRDTVKVEPVTTFESIKVLEAAGEYLKYNEDPDMEAYMDRCIDHWVLSQDKSGYFTGICLGDQQVFGHVAKGRWNNLQYSHELYGVGHLLEAALSYAEATGKTKILEAALRATDQVFSIFNRYTYSGTTSRDMRRSNAPSPATTKQQATSGFSIWPASSSTNAVTTPHGTRMESMHRITFRSSNSGMFLDTAYGEPTSILGQLT